MSKLGDGTRFKNLKKNLAKNAKVKNPAALAAAIGREKFGKDRMARLSKAGQERERQIRAGTKRTKI